MDGKVKLTVSLEGRGKWRWGEIWMGVFLFEKRMWFGWMWMVFKGGYLEGIKYR